MLYDSHINSIHFLTLAAHFIFKGYTIGYIMQGLGNI